MKKESNSSHNLRKGRFLWMKPDEQKVFVSALKNRIDSGYYFSDNTLASVVDELTPVMSDISGE